VLPDLARSQLETIARTTGQTLLLLRVGRDDDTLFTLPKGSEVREIEVGAYTMTALVALVAALDAGNAAGLLDVARLLNEKGVAARKQGFYDTAVLWYRFALAIAWNCGGWPHIQLLTRNLQWARSNVADLLRVNVTPPYPDGPEGVTLTTLPYLAGNILFSPAAEGSVQQHMRALHALIRDDAQALYERRESFGARVSAESAQIEQSRLECVCRLALIAGHDDALARLRELCEGVASSQHHDIAMAALLERLADVTLDDLLVEATDANDPTRAQERGFATLWTLFLSERQHTNEGPNPDSGPDRAMFAYRQFQYLRWQATCAGGPFGHHLSYRISVYLQPIGRDYVQALKRAGLTTDAFAIAEQLHARSMVDWMARSHHTNRLVRDPRLQGSANAVLPVGLSEIRAVAQRLQTPLLMYLQTGDGYDIWVQRPGGELIVAAIGDPLPQIRNLFAQLPYLAPGEGLACLDREQRAGPAVAATESSDLDACLNELCHTLLPDTVMAALASEAQRVVILPDSLLEYVPFAALRTDDGSYLLERFELAYWPSVTAWMLTQTAAETRSAVPDALRSMYRQGRFTGPGDPVSSGGPGAVVVGDPAFPATVQIQLPDETLSVGLEPLPGTRVEAEAVARILGVAALLGPEASLEAVLDRANVVPVVHLATHGVFVTQQPEESFVALAAGALTARSLYDSDRPIIAELVVLSACQTALGAEHPDSLIGLTNAFLIAGADSVISTLWSIDDDRTVELMTRLYRSLVEGVCVPAALRCAQRAILSQPQWRHPQYWAAFKAIGSEANPLRASGPAPVPRA
jgi:CHAT domain-containing protein